jgi:hypothetical protein
VFPAVASKIRSAGTHVIASWCCKKPLIIWMIGYRLGFPHVIRGHAPVAMFHCAPVYNLIKPEIFWGSRLYLRLLNCMRCINYTTQKQLNLVNQARCSEHVAIGRSRTHQIVLSIRSPHHEESWAVAHASTNRLSLASKPTESFPSRW